MTDDDLLEIAHEFRQGIIGDGSSDGYCYMVAAPLAAMLRAIYKIDCELVKSDHSENLESCWYEHFWIKLSDGRALDPTFDQLCDGNATLIYLGVPTRFHQSN